MINSGVSRRIRDGPTRAIDCDSSRWDNSACRHMHIHSVTHVYTSTLWLTSAACVHMHLPSGSRVQHVYTSTIWLTNAACVYIHPLAHGCSMCTHPPSRTRAYHAACVAHLHQADSAHFRTHVHARWCMHLTHRRVAGFANRMKTSSAAAALATAALGSSFSTNPRCTAVSNGGSVGGGGVGGASASVDCDVVEMTTTAPTTTHTHPKRSVTQEC
jgi:hypothetical protein